MRTRCPTVLSLSFALSGFVAPAQEAGAGDVPAPAAALRTAAERLQEPALRVRYLLSRAQDSRVREDAMAALASLPGLDHALWSGTVRGPEWQRELCYVSLLRRGVPFASLVSGALADAGTRPLLALCAELRDTPAAAPASRALAPHLGAERTRTLVRAATGLAALGYPGAAAPLRAALVAHGCACTRAPSGLPRAHVSFTTQTAYIRDYEPEIA
ncbi:MAG: hypothetical protein AB7O97_17255 [Planctomycetota bacterium]